MSNVFNGIQKAVFNVIGTTFGNPATWEPAAGGDTQTAIVLFKDPTEKHGLSDVDFNAERYQMEYWVNDFVGLKESVSSGTVERVTIETDEGTNLQFLVRRIERKYDGKTIIAYLSPTE